jgi:hypothetical protein
MANEPGANGSAHQNLLPGVRLVTFGIECELVLAFHESLLIPHIEPNGLTVIKDLTHWQRKELNNAHQQYADLGHKQYMSWALRGKYADVWFHYLHKGKRDQFVRPDLKSYWAEPLLIGRDILLSVTDIYVFEERTRKLDVFTRWCLMNDYSVPGYSRKRLISKFRDRIHPGEENNWDSWGCELISPVLSTHSDAFGQIRSVLSALAGDSRSLHGCRSTYLGGLHVHIELPGDHWPEELRLATLQHLAYILFLVEPTISSLHPHHRRPYNDPSNPHYEDLEPNGRVLDPGYFVDYDDPDEYYYSLRRDWGDKSTQQPPTIVSTRRLRQS